MIRLTKIFTFETAHALWGYDGKCKNVHGHSYKLYVTIKGNPIDDIHNSKNGMVMDFGDLKVIVNELIVDPFDHAILLNSNSEHKRLGDTLIKEGHKVIFTDYQPTCENMLSDFALKIQSRLPQGIILAKLKLYETETSYGEWIKEDQ
ncbi:6-carboxytetrahydropterin synthase [Apibacter raozihei]|uniref:6-pyruvoyl trahydropterin synthase family protein n=1 Tax=Apibacter raozihei TaxID=2500547 RepID=UPI000FE38020|nr:6-carboxytetrahydropterin synthase [Apibacter raozihei]